MFMRTTREIEEFVGRTYSIPGDIVSAIENLRIPSLTRPADPPTAASRTDIRIWEEEVKSFVKRQNILQSNVQSVYAVAWGQCTEGLRERIRSHANYTATA